MSSQKLTWLRSQASGCFSMIQRKALTLWHAEKLGSLGTRLDLYSHVVTVALPLLSLRQASETQNQLSSANQQLSELQRQLEQLHQAHGELVGQLERSEVNSRQTESELRDKEEQLASAEGKIQVSWRGRGGGGW